MKNKSSVLLNIFMCGIAASIAGCGGDDISSTAVSPRTPAGGTSNNGPTGNGALPTPSATTPAPANQYISKQIPVAPPVMGWASWNAYGCAIDEGKIRAAADYIESSGLKAAGYQNVNVDDCWAALTRDAHGNLAANPTSFPSGMLALGNYIHSKGLKFGIYGSPGPKTCAELNPGRKYPGVTGSLGHEIQDATTFANWGVDFLKYDWCWPNKATTAAGQVSYFQSMRDALNAAGDNVRKHITFSINSNSYGPTSAGRGYYWGNVADMWRTTDDIVTVPTSGAITARYASVIANNFEPNIFPDAQHTGSYNDPDMMMIASGMTATEDRTHFSLWAISGAPLILGNAFSTFAPLNNETLSVITNPEVIAVDQDGLGLQGVIVNHAPTDLQVIAKPLMGGGRRAVALFNNTAADAPMTVTWTQLGLDASSPATVRDLWAHSDLGAFSGSYSAPLVPSHGVVMLMISGVDGPAISYAPNQLSGSSAWKPCSTCSSGKIVSSLGGINFGNVTSGTYGGYLRIAYRNTGSQVARANLSVNDGPTSLVNFPPSGNDGTIGTVTVYAPLTASQANSIVLSSLGSETWAPDIDSIAIVTGPVRYVKPTVAYEAEASVNTISGGAKSGACSGCSGGKSVGYIGNGGTLTFNGISVPKSGTYTVQILYANGKATARAAQVSFNGAAPVTVSFPPTGSFATTDSMQVTGSFNTGAQNTLTISNPSGWAPDIDGISAPLLQ
ncbi:alpha-galactosidase [Burkholderia contaminans]|uniref:alpha-galactosidase n=1 Tax=Burkholderia contaminans TaxID=488447 RepID=UPI001589AC30|nr:alpha-galactosidase [Burkholderia contaminans]